MEKKESWLRGLAKDISDKKKRGTNGSFKRKQGMSRKEGGETESDWEEERKT